MDKTKKELILEIQCNDKLSYQEKMKIISKIFNNIVNNPSNITDCKHYDIQCIILSPCCNKWVGCRLCHNEAQLCENEFDRFKINKIKCKKCLKVQNKSNKCENCNTKFANNYCTKCNVWTNENIFHCEDCGICRVGEKNNFIHCKNCDGCFEKEHKCVQSTFISNRNTQCPICLEILFESRNKFIILNCGHKIHNNCFKDNINKNNYKCPMCKKSAIDMTNIWYNMKIEKNNTIMPEEYLGIQVKILCLDCKKENLTDFHVVGLECQFCNSFNTQRI